MSKVISGVNKQCNLDKWANYAKRNSYDGNDCRRQSRHDLDASIAPGTLPGQICRPKRQRREEGLCWAEINPAAKPNTYDLRATNALAR